MNSTPKKRIVLLGVGHTHCHVVHQWMQNPIAGAQLTVISDFPNASYSGMVPGVLAGQYSPETMNIELTRLCRAAEAELIIDRVQSIDVHNKVLTIADRKEAFDLLSIGVGSRPKIPEELQQSSLITPIKPMQTFLDRLKSKIDRQKTQNRNSIRACIVGGGVAGIEIAFCLHARLSKQFEQSDVVIVTADRQIASGCCASAQRRIQKLMLKKGIQVLTNTRIRNEADLQSIGINSPQHLNASSSQSNDVVLWATSAVAHPWFREIGLSLDSKGFLATRSTLLSVDSDFVFVVGDSGTMIDSPTPKAGVYAVRQGPVLWENIRRWLDDQPLEPFRPQSGFLKLINTGDGRAIAEYRGWSLHSRWAWKLKDWIDRQFIAKYQFEAESG